MIVGFDNNALLPVQWREARRDQIVRAFNPGLLPFDGGWLFAYRVVTDPNPLRRIAVCQLDHDFRIIEGSQYPLTDFVRVPNSNSYPVQATSWFADPRLYRLQERLFIYWNSGWHEPQNCQFLQELDSRSLEPVGPPRELTLNGPRQKLEKNWTFFESGSDVFALYSVNPHRVLRVALDGTGPIECRDAGPPIPNPGGYAKVHGGLRGGSPPVLVRGHYYAFCHSIENDSRGYRYAPAVYRFSASPPFEPAGLPERPLDLHIPSELHRRLPKLNPAVSDVVYPGGAAFCDGRWLVSLGIDDERCAIAILDDSEVCGTLPPAN